MIFKRLELTEGKKATSKQMSIAEEPVILFALQNCFCKCVVYFSSQFNVWPNVDVYSLFELIAYDVIMRHVISI